MTLSWMAWLRSSAAVGVRCTLALSSCVSNSTTLFSSASRSQLTVARAASQSSMRLKRRIVHCQSGRGFACGSTRVDSSGGEFIVRCGRLSRFCANKKTLIWQRDSPKNTLVPPAVHELSDHDWIDLEVIREITNAIKIVQEELEGEQYITRSRVIPLLQEVRARLDSTRAHFEKSPPRGLWLAYPLR